MKAYRVWTKFGVGPEEIDENLERKSFTFIALASKAYELRSRAQTILDVLNARQQERNANGERIASSFIREEEIPRDGNDGRINCVVLGDDEDWTNLDMGLGGLPQ